MKLLANVREVLRSLKHGKPSKIYCPRCCSSEINLSSGLDIWLTPRQYICNSCGYIGPIIMVVEKEEEAKVD